MIEFVQGLQWWHWWIVAAILAAVETFMPGAVAIWFAGSAMVIGSLLLVVPLPWQLQLVTFGLLGLAAAYVYRRYFSARDQISDEPLLNRRGAQYVGQTFTLVEPLRNGNGKIRVGDTVWLVHGKDLPEGARVRVTGVRGAALEVEPA